MADTYTLPVLTAADINGIVTAGQDGTYNITYTNLTANQIAEIGVAFETAMKNNLKPVAINNGDYDDLTKKPIIPNGYTEESTFNKVAFSGKASDLNNDSGFLTSFTEIDPVFSASVAANITNNDIENWNNKSNFSGNYEDLNGAPSLPEDINNEGHAYETINNQRQLKTLKDIAFTGDYNDLINIPSTVNSLLSLNLFEKEDNLADNNQLYQLGETNTYITDFDQFTAIVNSELTLATVIQNMALNNLNNGKSIYLKNNQTSYFVNKIELITTNDTIQYIKFIIYTMRDNFDITLNSNNAQNQLNNLNLVPVLKCIIFDYINNIIYCKIHDI